MTVAPLMPLSLSISLATFLFLLTLMVTSVVPYGMKGSIVNLGPLQAVYTFIN